MFDHFAHSGRRFLTLPFISLSESAFYGVAPTGTRSFKSSCFVSMAQIWRAILFVKAMATRMRGLAVHLVQSCHGANDQRLPDVSLVRLADLPKPVLAS